MKNHALLIGSASFLRLWSVLGCMEKIVPARVGFQELKEAGLASGAEAVLYEETLVKSFSSLEKKYFQESVDPYWIPLPAVEGGELK
ncbi:MAG: hypothetical protein SOY64_00675 [Pyramidobacter sp.]|uniref:hypothetical protein n=1 Tax=unclassified Pyramidobacter TaxID=2632171 RepID=UPI00098FA1AC|nr:MULTISPECIES: hypothetical protein [unclassified Pyramidobacter]MCI7402942.1 hypothetical protein [Pyramidobacter sp.]MDY3211404.1 hypothetical protein [Pyramidobacter sp.]MDY4031567.1 hypothetical protein [Pyramidobacter sp.]OON88543.1 hypothetical protein B0D78_08490 [Pyramidobacter sp. C12-8]RKJ77421.1 hypothetical protein D7D26_08735 [Pyramidobacter sp. CG50-2]